MRALRCNAFGAPESLVVEDIASPVPGQGEVLVDVKAAGVNFPDSLIIQNKYQIKPPLPFTPGGELAGVVRAVGPGVTQVKVGQSVIAFTLWGAFAEQALVPQDKLIPMPEGMPYEIAGSFLMTYGTCYHALHDRARVQAGETVLVLGAGGGIGIAAIELAKAMGARVIAAASSDAKLQVCRSQGADDDRRRNQHDAEEVPRLGIFQNRPVPPAGDRPQHGKVQRAHQHKDHQDDLDPDTIVRGDADCSRTETAGRDG